MSSRHVPGQITVAPSIFGGSPPPHPDIRIIKSGTTTATCYVHRDQLAPVTLETDATGAIAAENR